MVTPRQKRSYLFSIGQKLIPSKVVLLKGQYRMRKSSLKLVKNEILEFDARKKPEGFYLTSRHLRSVGRVVQRLHSSTPYCFLHADSESLAFYYTKLIVRKIELLGENLILRFNPLRKEKLIDVLNNEIENFSLDKALEVSRPDKKRRIILIENEEELISEDWQDIELLCTGLPGINLGLICNASGINQEILAATKLMKDKRVSHAFFNSPTNSELRMLSVVARQSSKNAKILKILEQLGLRYNFAHSSDIAANLSDEGRFDDFLRRAESDIKTDAKESWSKRLIPTKKYLLLLGVMLIAFYALIASIN